MQKNLEESAFYFSLAAEQGDAEGQRGLKFVNNPGRGGDNLIEDPVSIRWIYLEGLISAVLMAGIAFPSLAQMDRRQTAIALEKQGKTVEAEAAWIDVANAYPKNPEPWAHLGLLEARQEHYAEAIRYYKKAFAIDSAMPGLRLNMGLAMFKNGDYKEAVEDFGILLKSQPDDQRLIVLMGMSRYGLGEYGAATPFLQRASEQDATNLTLLLTLAHSCLLSQQYQCVLDTFHRMEALNADSAEADMLVGEALSEMKDTNGAIREFHAAAAANPKEPNVHFGLGYLLWTERQYPEAASEFQFEVNNDPRHLKAMLYLADSLIQMTKFDDAKPILESAVRIDPKSSMARLDLGIVYSEEDDKKRALEQLQEAARLAPSDVNAHFRLGRLYRSMGKASEAKVEFDLARSLNKKENDSLLKMMSGLPDGAKPSKQSQTE